MKNIGWKLAGLPLLVVSLLTTPAFYGVLFLIACVSQAH